MKLGDAVASVTKKLGIEPCDACKKRQEWLNNAHDWLLGLVKKDEHIDDFEVITVYEDAEAPPSTSHHAVEADALSVFWRMHGAFCVRSVSVRKNGSLVKFWSRDHEP